MNCATFWSGWRFTCDKEIIGPEDLALVQRASGAVPISPFRGTLEEVEREYISSILKEENGKVAQAAARLGVPRSTLYQKIKILGIEIEQAQDSKV